MNKLSNVVNSASLSNLRKINVSNSIRSKNFNAPNFGQNASSSTKLDLSNCKRKEQFRAAIKFIINNYNIEDYSPILLSLNGYNMEFLDRILNLKCMYGKIFARDAARILSSINEQSVDKAKAFFSENSSKIYMYPEEIAEKILFGASLKKRPIVCTAKSANAEVIKLEDKMKQMGYDANFSDNIEAAQIITGVYEKMTKKGFKMPKEVRLMIPDRKDIRGCRPYAPKGREYETPILFDRNLGKKNIVKSFLNFLGINECISPEHVVYHEIGHFLHDFSKLEPKQAQAIWREYVKDGGMIKIADEVGAYAAFGDIFKDSSSASGGEFVAEIFAGLMEGKEYSSRIMELYTKLGGSDINTVKNFNKQEPALEQNIFNTNC